MALAPRVSCGLVLTVPSFHAGRMTMQEVVDWRSPPVVVATEAAATGVATAEEVGWQR